jgi:ABC-type branched-subunit amino acid transport system substrate-binding protein
LSWATENEARKVAILFNGDSAYYSETNHLLTEELARRDIRVVFSDTYRPGDIDFNISLSLMEAYGPDTVFFLGSYNERKEFVKVNIHAFARRPRFAGKGASPLLGSPQDLRNPVSSQKLP